MTSQFWRPIDFEKDSDEERRQQEPPKKKQHRCKVTEKEEEIVLQAYKLHGSSGWEVVLENVKEHVSTPMTGNVLKNEKLREYYHNVQTKTAIKRMQRIINLNVQKPVSQPAESVTQSQRMSNSIKQNMTRYSSKCSPEQRKSNKFAHASNLDLSSNSAISSADEDIVKESVINPDLPQTSKVSKESKDDKRERKLTKKSSSSRGKLAKQASKSHMDMCEKAMKIMDKIGNILKKYDSSDETD